MGRDLGQGAVEQQVGILGEQLLPARIADYRPAWLDDECRAGRLRWTSLRRRAPGATAMKSTSLSLLVRRHAGLWQVSAPAAELSDIGAKAETVRAFLDAHGAAFFEDIAEGTKFMRVEIEDALGELVAAGFVTADSFNGLRALMPAARSERRNLQMENAGRWALLNRRAETTPAPEAIEHIARILLARYGVVFWRLLDREAAGLPSWRELLGVYRRLEARGEIRGGRFVAGFSGEQFALPEAIGSLRDIRRKLSDGELISLSGADPLNLVGILTPGPKLSAITGNRVLFRDGTPIATLTGGETAFIESVPENQQWNLQKVLLRNPLRSRTRHPPEDAVNSTTTPTANY